MNISSIPGLRSFDHARRYHGTRAAMAGLCYRIASRTAHIRVLDLIAIDLRKVIPAADTDLTLDFRFLTPDDIRELAQDPLNDLGEAMADRLDAGHDLCFAAFDGERLVSYAWFALGAVEADHGLGVAMSFPFDTAYLYKAYVHPDYRGRRVHQFTLRAAFAELSARGFLRVVAMIEYGNFGSVRAHERLGFVRLGRNVICGKGAQPWEWFPRRAAELGLMLGSRADLSARQHQPVSV
jgi:GNAT superfamily N-acetyltransferase